MLIEPVLAGVSLAGRAAGFAPELLIGPVAGQ
ncbi:hypothetical protein SAMN05216207_10739 [Pseudonocardia ammonioxydans]|uniref:Uncharacterized protein n=1 Tax=Pseudonocardia ammonioxydans TaxID=260086 RepID=A0A1I5HRG5_PSUAM|nr:hypothetical protein SAMN05216207_10739 [Pseudonocardia ammonioxydans]